MKKIATLIILSVLIISCSVTKPAEVSSTENQDQLLLSVLWFQKSAEMKALFYQGYNIAEKSLLEKIKSRSGQKPGAVIMDIDETILDNSPSEVFLIINNVPYSDQLWKKWVGNSTAEACPGALDFVNSARQNGIEIFYVTNRQQKDELQPTILNLNKLGFPYADTLHIVMKTDISSKEARRKTIAEKYDILMLIGDNLADFDSVFDNRGTDLGFGPVIQNKEKFGTEFIILPNPMYGPWINAAIQDKQGATTREKILNALNGF
jgi:5'-nucleotidase (lipoprotein e(P4) family)